MKALKDSDIPTGRLHDLRHTFASWMIEAGADLSAVQSILGHKDYRTTLGYRHLSAEYLKNQIRRLHSREET